MSVRAAAVLAALVVLAASPRLTADQVIADPAFLQAFTWRHLGPTVGGRATAAAGVPGSPNVFYIGTADGGIWKTTDAGQSWQPVFDAQPAGSIGAMAVAPSDAGVIYAGTGTAFSADDPSPGDGLYRSSDAGVSWVKAGLGESRYITRIAIDTSDPQRLFVAAIGDRGPASGVFRSTDGGRTWQQVLPAGGTAAALDVAIDPRDARIVYAALVSIGPGASAAAPTTDVGLFRSNDGGTTWQRALGPELEAARGVVSVAVAPDGRRVFALAPGAGLFSSTDGLAWMRVPAADAQVTTGAARVHTAGHGSAPPQLYVSGEGVWRSEDLGATFQRWPGIEPSETVVDLWANPAVAGHALVVGPRGASVTVNDGQSWTSVENQPFARFLSVAVDNVYPFRVCGANPVTGAGCVTLRAGGSAAGDRDWRSIGDGRNRFVAVDPADPDVLYTGSVTRIDRRLGQRQDISPDVADSRPLADAPLLFSPAEPRALLYGTDLVWKSTTSGQTWVPISPSFAPPGRSAAQPAAGAAIASLAPSPVDARTLWVGTRHGAIHVTRDAGTTWREVTPPETDDRVVIASIEASHFDANTAYVTLDRRRTGDFTSHLLRTRDGGQSWTNLGSALPADATVHVVREDQFRRGLLFAGTSRSVFVSFDDGDRWQALRLNLPPTRVRDLAIRESTLVAATDGRGFWALDDISVLRQITADILRSPAFLFRPATAWRSAARTLTPSGAPVGAETVALSYWLGTAASPPVSLEIIETATGDVIRRFSSADGPDGLPTTAGLHDVLWDLRYTPVSGRAPLVAPGAYQVRLTVNGQSLRQAVLVRPDPRVRASAPELAALLKQLRTIQARRGELASALARTPDPGRTAVLTAALARLDQLFDIVQQADVRPTAAVEAAIATALDQAGVLINAAGP